MGVSELWSILDPTRESVPLYSLTGKTLAVDLSLWVCEAQFVKEMAGRVTKPHLRNLFFRVSTLTQMGIKLIFVMEGEPPKIKAETMSKRTELRFGKSKMGPKKMQPSRSRFKFVLKECAEMLDCLGVPWVTAAGEAEAMCAYLDSAGFVDGCITNDGDVFLYGAQTVYRNFNLNSKDPQVDCYKMPQIRSKLHLERETLVGLAILLGCDYIPKGIPGVGTEQTLKLIQSLQGQTLLQKFSQWKNDGLQIQEKPVKKVAHCHVCRHPGSAKTHEHRGCKLCDSERFCEPQDYDYACPCDWHGKQTLHTSSVELNVKRKVLASSGFPFSEIINEFLVPKDKPISNVKRRKPNLLLMQDFASAKMNWPKHYTSAKVLVLMTYTEMMNRKYGRTSSLQLQPIRICKPRIRNGIACFEIIWKKPEYYLHADDHPLESQDIVTTVEEESLVRAAYPELVNDFLKVKEEAEENKLKKKKRRDKNTSEPKEPDAISDLLSLMTLHGSPEDEMGRSAVAVPRTPDVNTTDHRSGLEALCRGHTELGGPEGTRLEVGARALSPAFSGKTPEARHSSPVSMVIKELQLSDIDWEALSFTSSPQVEKDECGALTQADFLTGCNNANEEKCVGHKDVKKGSSIKSPVRIPHSRAVVDLSECSLKSRVLMKNTKGYSDSNVPHIVTSTTQTNQSILLNKFKDIGPKMSDTGSKLRSNAILSGPPQMGEKKELFGTGQELYLKHNWESSVSKLEKKSVCVALCSSEDSDTENAPAPVGLIRQGVRSKARPRFPYRADLNQKTETMVQTASSKAVSNLRDLEFWTTFADKDKRECGASKGGTLVVNTDEGVCSLSSPISVSQAGTSDEEDSLLSLDSPLPLAERLKLKF